MFRLLRSEYVKHCQIGKLSPDAFSPFGTIDRVKFLYFNVHFREKIFLNQTPNPCLALILFLQVIHDKAVLDASVCLLHEVIPKLSEELVAKCEQRGHDFNREGYSTFTFIQLPFRLNQKTSFAPLTANWN